MSQQLGLFDAPLAPRPCRSSALPVVKGGRPEVRYRHPDDPGMAWTGRGKPPRWVADWIENGKPLEALQVPGARS